MAFNFGGRRLSVAVVKWDCDHLYAEPALAIYADCTIDRGKKRSERLVLVGFYTRAVYAMAQCLSVCVCLTQRFLSAYHTRCYKEIFGILKIRALLYGTLS